jgi:hypothetical protein
MFLNVGNPAPIEAAIHPQTRKPVYRRMGGRRVTSFHFPDGITPREAALHVLDALPRHMEGRDGDGNEIRPAWFESDNKDLSKMLCQHFGIAIKNNKRPPNWGATTDTEETQ